MTQELGIKAMPHAMNRSEHGEMSLLFANRSMYSIRSTETVMDSEPHLSRLMSMASLGSMSNQLAQVNLYALQPVFTSTEESEPIPKKQQQQQEACLDDARTTTTEQGKLRRARFKYATPFTQEDVELSRQQQQRREEEMMTSRDAAALRYQQHLYEQCMMQARRAMPTGANMTDRMHPCDEAQFTRATRQDKEKKKKPAKGEKVEKSMRGVRNKTSSKDKKGKTQQSTQGPITRQPTNNGGKPGAGQENGSGSHPPQDPMGAECTFPPLAFAAWGFKTEGERGTSLSLHSAVARPHRRESSIRRDLGERNESAFWSIAGNRHRRRSDSNREPSPSGVSPVPEERISPGRGGGDDGNGPAQGPGLQESAATGERAKGVGGGGAATTKNDHNEGSSGHVPDSAAQSNAQQRQSNSPGGGSECNANHGGRGGEAVIRSPMTTAEGIAILKKVQSQQTLRRTTLRPKTAIELAAQVALDSRHRRKQN